MLLSVCPLLSHPGLGPAMAELYELDTSGSLAVLRQRLVSFARQHPDIFTEKPRDPPDYKEDPDRTNDLEQMEAELNGLKGS